MRRALALIPVTLVVLLGGAAQAAPVEKATFIVQVQRGSEASVEARARALGGEVGYRYDTALTGFSVTLPVAAANGLAHAAGVVAMEQDAPVTIDATQTSVPSWGLDRIDDRALTNDNGYDYTSTGANVTAYIIDTGIDASKTDFAARATAGINFVGSTSGDANWIDCNGHGTHVAGTVGSGTYGVAKGVALFAVRVLDCNGSGSTSGVIAGVNWVAKNHGSSLVVANMSLGGGKSTMLNTAVKNAVASGVVMAVAAGNSGTNACNSSPASEPSAITVGATDGSDARASFSNFGSCLDLFAPGVKITSYDYATGGPVTWNGTSMATPHVTGVVARYLSSGTIPAGATAANVTSTVTGWATTGVVVNAGKGSPNRELYVSPSL